MERAPSLQSVVRPAHTETITAKWAPAANKSDRWQWIAALTSMLIGVTLILNIHPVGDSMWQWYAADLRHGVHLYRDLHLSLQPVYVLLTAVFQACVGSGWLPSKLLPLLQLVVFVWVLVRLGRFLPWPAWQRALLTVAAFLFILRPSTYRFDDYHVTSDVFTLGALLLLLHLGARWRNRRAVVCYAFAMGLCCGLAAMTRLNDGAGLGVALAGMLLLLYPRRAIEALAGLVGGTMAAVAAVLLAIREHPLVWFHWSFAAASAIKGGTGSILAAPLMLPRHLLWNMEEWKTPLALLYVSLLWFAVLRVQQRYSQRTGKGWLGYAAIWLGALIVSLYPFVHHSQVETPLELLVRLAALLLLVLCAAVAVWALVRLFCGKPALQRPAEALLLLPLLHLVCGTFTSANALPDPYLSLAMLMFVLPLMVAPERSRRWALPLLATLVLLAAVVAGGKIRHPYYWWTYNDGPVYRDRVWYDHPELGYMYIERPELALMQNLCAPVRADGEPTELLSMPFPYPNYFCGVPPWHNYVQTWYDTSGPDTIGALLAELRTTPPRWISYEHNLNSIRGHEITYHHGAPLPHRQIDAYLMQQLAGGQWTLRVRQCLNHSDWMLIETRPVAIASDPAQPPLNQSAAELQEELCQ